MSCNTAYNNLQSAKARVNSLAKLKSGAGKATAVSGAGLIIVNGLIGLGVSAAVASSALFTIPVLLVSSAFGFSLSIRVGSGMKHQKAVADYRKALAAYHICLAKVHKSKSVP